MAVWQPRRTIQERNTRAIRSMQNGTLDGRVLGSPVRSSGIGEGYEEDTDDEEAGATAEEGITLLPFTDTFNPENASTLTFTLTFVPWNQPEMVSATRAKSSVHIYWNGVFQKDISYTLSGRILTINNGSLQIRAGDVISVKYFYEDGAEDDGRTTLYRMECWLSSVQIKDPDTYMLWGDRFRMGAVSSPPLGQNAGSITTSSVRFQSMEFLSTWRSNWRLPKDITIPTDSSVESITWLVYTDGGADFTISPVGLTTERILFHGNNLGTTVGGQGSCYGPFTACYTDVPPYVPVDLASEIENPSGRPRKSCWQIGWGTIPTILASQPGTAGAPSPGPTSGRVFSQGADGFALAKRANSRPGGASTGNHVSFSVNFSMPERGPIPSTCGSDNTIYGPYDFDVATYDVKLGVTCVVVRKE